MLWKELIADLLRAGLTQAEIAGLAGCSQSAISDMVRADREPRWRLACALQALHRKHVKTRRRKATGPVHATSATKEAA